MFRVYWFRVLEAIRRPAEAISSMAFVFLFLCLSGFLVDMYSLHITPFASFGSCACQAHLVLSPGTLFLLSRMVHVPP